MAVMSVQVNGIEVLAYSSEQALIQEKLADLEKDDTKAQLESRVAKLAADNLRLRSELYWVRYEEFDTHQYDGRFSEN